ncbi:MAG: hypothetical protein ISP55_06770 [Flavobacteriales bacterium]|nr:hypothetical protein [Flavobacteriales bacterium]
MMLRAYPLLLLAAATAFLVSGCGPKPGAEHLADLQQTLVALDSAEAVFQQAPLDDAAPAFAKADSALMAIESMMVGLVVNLEQGKPFDVLDQRRRMLRRQPGRHRRIEQELSRTRRQIGLLIEAIVDGATVDAEGTPIDTAYLNRSAADELRIASHLLEEIDIALKFLERGTFNLDGVIFTADSTARALASIPSQP